MTWEFRTVSGDGHLAALGREGWELVAVLPGPAADAPMLYFKRPAPDFRTTVTLEQKAHAYAQLGLRPGGADTAAP